MSSSNAEQPLQDQIRQTEEQLRIYEALTNAMGEAHAVLDVLLTAADPDSARIALQRRFGFDSLQAIAVMDIQFRRATTSDRTKIDDRRRELVEHLRGLQESAEDG